MLRPDFQYGDIRAALGRFQFSSEQVKTKLSQLSGGERARVALLKLLLEENNLLLMDEPTNHLDMDSKDTLEEALLNYEGSLVTVSHDRWFLDQVVNRIWELQDGVVTVYYGNYTDYVRAKKGLPPLADMAKFQKSEFSLARVELMNCRGSKHHGRRRTSVRNNNWSTTHYYCGVPIRWPRCGNQCDASTDSILPVLK